MGIFDKLFGKKTVKTTACYEKEGIENRDWNNYPRLRSAILKVRVDPNSDEWDSAKSIFEDEIKKMPNYFVPYYWLSKYYRNNTHGVDKALDVLNKGVEQCIRKSPLLNEMGEISLFDKRNIRDAVHYFVTAVKVSRGRLDPTDYTFQDSFLYLSTIFEYYEMFAAENWAKDQVRSGKPGDIEFTNDLLIDIHLSISNAINSVSKEELERIYKEMRS